MKPTSITSLLETLERLNLEDYGRDFLLTWDKPWAAIEATLAVAEILQELYRRNRSFRVFDAGVAVSNFRDKSTRTRYSFFSAATALGLSVLDLDEEKLQVAHGETVRETANMLSFLTEVIGIRDDIYLGAGNRYLREVAAAVDAGYREGVLPRRPAVINLQCDLDHPTQTLADLLHLKRTFGSLDRLKGKKIAVSWAYSPSYGKPLSVPQGIIALMTRLGMRVTLAYPEGYDLVPEIMERAHQQAHRSGGAFRVVHRMEDAFRGADVVYPKSWAPFRIMERRTELLQAGEHAALQTLERECLNQNARHRDWECNQAKMALTREGKALYLHCLPADISGVNCERGEVSRTVFETYRVQTYREAGYKPYIIAAMIWLTRLEDPVDRLKQLLDDS
jgi:knotted carbamoyltransferase YgeW